LFEDERTLAFLDVAPQSPGHALVISKWSKARNILEVEPEALAQVMATVAKVARAIDVALRPDGLRIVQFNGADAGQTVFHLHVHIIPQWRDAALAPHASSLGDAGERERIAALIVQAL